jgi:hypothetical protein
MGETASEEGQKRRRGEWEASQPKNVSQPMLRAAATGLMRQSKLQEETEYEEARGRDSYRNYPKPRRFRPDKGLSVKYNTRPGSIPGPAYFLYRREWQVVKEESGRRVEITTW